MSLKLKKYLVVQIEIGIILVYWSDAGRLVVNWYTLHVFVFQDLLTAVFGGNQTHTQSP